MSPSDRVALYRRVIGFLRLSELPLATLSERLQWELRGAIFEAMLVTGVMVESPRQQLTLLIRLLNTVLEEQSCEKLENS